MIPYRPQQIKPIPKTQRIKSLPSLQLTNLLKTVCQNSKNTYDINNHILTINDYQGLQHDLFEKFGRSLASFQKQLKMLGFKSKKYKQILRNNEQQGGKTQFYEVCVYKWKGKKQLLINQQLGYFEKNLSQRKHDMLEAREKIRKTRQDIDSFLEQIMFSLMVNPKSQSAKSSLNSLIVQTRQFVNSCEVQMQQLINKSSDIFGNQLELYRLLIYKQQKNRKKQENNEESNEDNHSVNSSKNQNKYNDNNNQMQQINDVPSPIPQQDYSGQDIDSQSDEAVSIKFQNSGEAQRNQSNDKKMSEQ